MHFSVLHTNESGICGKNCDISPDTQIIGEKRDKHIGLLKPSSVSSVALKCISHLRRSLGIN
jgi:hypothetical protein